MNPFAALLMGQQAAGTMADPNIVVPGSTLQQPDASDPYRDFSLNNSDAIRERVAAAEDGAEAAQHEGLFGVKGTLRDVLGTLGDAFLIQSGNNPMYHPHRQQEKLGDAMTGYTVNPMAAAERMAGVDPASAMQMGQFGRQQQAAMQQAQEAMQKNERLGVKDSRDAYESGAQMFGSYMGALSPETYAQGVPVLQAMKQQFGLGDEFQIPEAYDPNIAQMYQYGGMPTSRQVSSQQRDTQLGISQQNADTARQNARTRANVARPRSVSRQELFEQYRKVPPERRTFDQQEFIDEYTGQNRSSRGSSADKQKKTLGGSQSKTERKSFTVNGKTFYLD